MDSTTEQIIHTMAEAITSVIVSAKALETNNEVIHSDHTTRAIHYFTLALDELHEAKKEIESAQIILPSQTQVAPPTTTEAQEDPHTEGSF